MTPEQVKQARLRLGYSVKDMAKAIGVDARLIRRFEKIDPETGKGVREPRGPCLVLYRLAHAGVVTQDDLWDYGADEDAFIAKDGKP